MEIQRYISEIENEMINVRRHIHENPELSLNEVNTTAFIKETLKNTRIEWQETGLDVGLVGLLDGGAGEGPVLALRGDIDALPIYEDTGLPFSSKKEGVMHACGHDLHTTVLIGTAIVLDRLIDTWKGKIKFIFQQAEETMDGAKQMIEASVLNSPTVDHIVCLHTWPSTDAGKIGIKKGSMMAASDMFHIEVIGSGGHAAHPQKSIDPIPIAVDIITSHQKVISRNLSPLDSAVITVGEIHGGSASNIIANSVKFSGTVRTLNRETQFVIQKRMKEIAFHIAAASNAKAIITFNEGCPPVINDDFLVDIMERALVEHLGSENIDYLREPSMGGEDFSFYMEHVPGMLFRLGTGTSDERTRRPLHNPGVVFDEKAISTGILAMSGFALEYLK